MVCDGRKDACSHCPERGVRLLHLIEYYLRHDGTKLPARGSNTVPRGAVPRGKELPRNDEGRYVRPEIGEEVR